MSMIIGFISQKGGVGKSTLARAIAREGVSNGLSVKIADLDIQQATSTNWNRRRLGAEIEPTISVQPFKTSEQAIKEANNVDLLVIDGPARTSKASLEIAKHSDLIIQPTGASIDDLEPAILAFHELTKAGIPKSKLVLALCRVGTEAELKACLEYIENAGFEVLEGCLYEKPAYRQAQNSGFSITETKYKKLNEKADLLLQSLINKIT